MDSELSTVEEKIISAGYEDVVIFKDFDYDTAFIGISNDNRAVYDYDLMVEYLMTKEGWSWEEAVEWIDYNTIRALAYQPDGPIVLYRIEE